MKYAYAFLAALLLVGASASPLKLRDDDELSELDHDISDFYKLIPQDKFIKVVEDHAEDPELWKVFDYVLSDNFHKLIYAAEDLHEFHRYVLYLQKAGYNAIRELRDTHEALGMKEYIPPKHPNATAVNMKKGGGLNGFVDDLIAILPKEAIKEMHEAKLEESPAFVKFSSAVRSPTFTEIRVNLYNQPAMQNLLQGAKANGFDFQKVYSFRSKLLGFS